MKEKKQYPVAYFNVETTCTAKMKRLVAENDQIFRLLPRPSSVAEQEPVSSLDNGRL